MGIFDIDYGAPYIRYDTVFEWERIKDEWKEINPNPELYEVHIKGDFSKIKKEETKMEKLTKEEAIRKHRALWAYMAAKLKEGNITKEEAICDIFTGQGYPYNKCYLCDYARSKCDEYKYAVGTDDICNYCPLCDDGKSGSNCLSGKFNDFNRARQEGDYARASEIAFEIATLPEVDRDRKTYADKVLEKVKNIYEEERGLLARTFESYDSSDYIWMFGYDVIYALKSKCDYKINVVDETAELFGIKVTEDKVRPETIRLYKVQQGRV